MFGISNKIVTRISLFVTLFVKYPIYHSSISFSYQTQDAKGWYNKLIISILQTQEAATKHCSFVLNHYNDPVWMGNFGKILCIIQFFCSSALPVLLVFVFLPRYGQESVSGYCFESECVARFFSKIEFRRRTFLR